MKPLMVKKSVYFFVSAILAFRNLGAQKSVWQPSPGHTQVAIWPEEAPDARTAPGPETVETTEAPDLVAGKPYRSITNVSHPTMTVYAPKGRNTGAAVVVFPGGGYEILAIDLEGTEVCDWLTARGITCVLLKYRVPSPERSGADWGAYPQSPMALEDAQRTIGLVRLHAAEWHVNPSKIGVMGFSAGGHLVAAISTHFDKRIYAPLDAADRESCRPDFARGNLPRPFGVPRWEAEPQRARDEGDAADVFIAERGR